MKGCLFLAFFPIPLWHATKKLDIFFNIVCRTESLWQTEVLFVALSHCDKQNFCLSHWVPATNKICICCQKVAKSVNNAQLFGSFGHFWGLFVPFMHFRGPYFSTLLIFFYFWATFWPYTQILFVAVTQCDKQFVCLLQWLQQRKILFVAVTQCNKQYWKKYPISLLHVTKELKKKS